MSSCVLPLVFQPAATSVFHSPVLSFLFISAVMEKKKRHKTTELNPISILFLFLSSPVDHSRVKLALKTTNQDTDYVNANFIKVKTQVKWFLLFYLPPCRLVTLEAKLLLTDPSSALCSGYGRPRDLHRNAGPAAQHCHRLLEDELGVQRSREYRECVLQVVQQ